MRVRYFAAAAEAAGCDACEVSPSAGATLAEVALAGVPDAGDSFTRVVGVSSFLVDGRIYPGSTRVGELPGLTGVDVLPPFAGG